MFFLALLVSLIQDAPAPEVRVETAHGFSMSPSISADGEWIAFVSSAADLVEGDADRATDVFVHSRATHETERIGGDGAIERAMPVISGDGRWIAYWIRSAPEAGSTGDAHEWRLVLHDGQSGNSRVIEACRAIANSASPPPRVSLSDDGRRVAYLGVHGALSAAMLLDLESNERRMLSVSDSGLPAFRDVTDVRLSRNGRFAVFCTDALNLAVPVHDATQACFEFRQGVPHVFLRDIDKQTTRYASDRALQSDGYAGYDTPWVTDDGRFVGYNHNDPRRSYSRHVGFISDLIENRGGRLIAASHSEDFQGAIGIEWLSRDGGHALVESATAGLDPASFAKSGEFSQADRSLQLYSYERASGAFRKVTDARSSRALRLRRGELSVTEDGRRIAFATYDDTLAERDQNRDLDVVVLSLEDGSLELISRSIRSRR